MNRFNTAADLGALLGEVGVERATVCGVSMGGVLAQRLAIDHPDLVDALVLSDSFSGVHRAIARLNARAGEVGLSLLPGLLQWKLAFAFFLCDDIRVDGIRQLALPTGRPKKKHPGIIGSLAGHLSRPDVALTNRSIDGLKLRSLAVGADVLVQVLPTQLSRRVSKDILEGVVDTTDDWISILNPPLDDTVSRLFDRNSTPGDWLSAWSHPPEEPMTNDVHQYIKAYACSWRGFLRYPEASRVLAENPMASTFRLSAVGSAVLFNQQSYKNVSEICQKLKR